MATALMSSTVEPTLERPLPDAIDAGNRGDLTIGAGVVEKIAQRAALEVPGVVDVVSRGLSRVVGGGNAGASAEVLPGARQDQSRTARIDLTLSLRYPAPAMQTTRAVRDHVVERVQQLTGLRVERVDITVAELDNDPSRSSGRVQ